MKRLILISTLFIFIFASCDGPVDNFIGESRESPTPALSGNVVPDITYSTEPVRPDTTRWAAWQQFRSQNGEQWRIRWNEHTGLPVSVFAGKTEKTYPDNPESAARAFLADHPALFAMQSKSTGLHHKATSRNPYGLTRVTFQQQYEGIPVQGAEYIVQIYKDGRVGMANGYYYPNITVPTTPSVASARAIATAKSDLKLTNPLGESNSAELVVYLKEDGTFTLAWKTIIFAEQPITDWLYYVDASSGSVLKKHSRMMDVTGDGDVYPAHPGLSSVTNKPLYRLSGSGTLQGTYASIVNDAASEAYAGNHSFIYPTGNTHFDEVNLYYHVDDFRQNFIGNLEYPGDDLTFTQITAHAHWQANEVNARFIPSTGDIYFGDASPDPTINNFAREDMVIYHEYGHAVIYDIQSGIASFPNEEGAISEGTPDYFAGAHSGRSLSGAYVLANDPDAQRDMANPDITNYDDLSTDPQTGEVDEEAHDGGEFFSSVLWDLRGSMNPDDADFLVYEALHGVTGDPSFLDFRDAMMTADNAAYNGNNNDLNQ